MVSHKYVQINGEYVRSNLTPKQLERDYKVKGGFVSKPRQLIVRLAKAYNLRWTIKFERIDQTVYCYASIHGLIEIATGVGNSQRKACRSAAYRIHRIYCKLLKDESQIFNIENN